MSSRFAIPYGYTTKTGTFLAYTDTRHLCTIAPTRSGKGATVIMQALLQAPHSVVVVDPKGQNAAVTARHRRAMGHDVFVLNPFGMHTGAPWHLPRHRYNPLASFNINSPSVVADMGALAQALLVTQGREPYFDDTARDLVKTLGLFLVSTLGPKASLGQLRKMVTDIAARGKEAADLLVAIGRSPYPFIRQPIGRFMDAEARDISSAVNSAITQTSFLDDPAFTDPVRGALSASDFSLAQLKKKPTTIYLILPGRYMTDYMRFLRLMVTSALDAITAEPGGHPVLMILDEFARLENLPSVSSAFGFAAGFNLQLWPFLQDLAQLEDVYGKKGMSFLANSGLIQFFCPTDMTTAEYLQRRGGNHTVLRRSNSYGGSLFKLERSETRSESNEALLRVERTMSMADDEALVFFAGMHEPMWAERAPYWRIPRLKETFDPDPYHLEGKDG